MSGFVLTVVTLGIDSYGIRVETSLLWSLEPGCTDVSRFPAVDAPGPHFAMGADARQVDRRTGERMVADEVRFLGAKAEELLAAYAHARPAHTLRTFADVERLWTTVVLPALPTFRTMQPLWPDQQPPAPDSPWFANWPIPPIR